MQMLLTSKLGIHIMKMQSKLGKQVEKSQNKRLKDRVWTLLMAKKSLKCVRKKIK